MTQRFAMTRTDALAAAIRAAPDAIYAPFGTRLIRWITTVALVSAFVWLCIDVDLVPATLGAGLEKLGRFLSGMFPPNAAGNELRILSALAATIGMAIAGTVLAVLGALPLGLVGAKTVVSNGAIHFALRRVFDVLRGVPALVWALILISAFGLGPFGGVIALALSDVPRLAKLYAEAIEACDDRPSQGVLAAGGTPWQAVRFGVVPQVVPVMVSQSLYTLESNFRNAAVLGIVGAGGIGFELEERIRIFAFDQVAWILIAYVLCVMALDWASERIRAQLV